MPAPARAHRTVQATRSARLLAWLLAVAALIATAPARATEPAPVSVPTLSAGATPAPSKPDDAAMAAFLDRRMRAESGGRDDARNPRSTAVGPFQFIESTFLEVCRRHFAAETQGLTVPQILALRTSRPFARRAAEAFTRDNAGILADAGIASTADNMRLAFLLGAAGAVRVLKAEPAAPVIAIVGAGVVQANPFMAGMTAQDLAAWSGRNLAGDASVVLARSAPSAEPPPAGDTSAAVPQPPVGKPAAPARPQVKPRCNLDLASCRKWLALAESRVAKRITVASATPARRAGRLR